MFSWVPCAPVMRWAPHLLCTDPRPWVPFFFFLLFYVEGWIWLFSQPSAPLSPVWYLKLLTSCLAGVGSGDGNRTVMAGVLLLHLLSSLYRLLSLQILPPFFHLGKPWLRAAR